MILSTTLHRTTSDPAFKLNMAQLSGNYSVYPRFSTKYLMSAAIEDGDIEWF